jgi:protein-tyrosine phosphatase
VAEPFSISFVAFDGGGRVGLAPMPGRGADLTADVDMIASWTPRLVVTLAEDKELAEKGAATLPQLLAARGIAHRSFPIVDYGAPQAGDAAWAAVSGDLHSVLDAGGGVLVHCMGGCGRSGMIALRLMVERGEAPEAALARLRAERPCAVETDQQLEWASQPARNAT